MLTLFCSPQAKVNMCSTPCLIEERLWCKSSEQAEVSRYSTCRFAHQTHIICCTQYIGVANREFLLCRAKLRMEQFNRNTLGFQSRQNSVNHLCLIIKPSAAIAQAICWRFIISPLFTGQIKLGLNPHPGPDPLVGQALHHLLEKCAWAC